VKVKVQSDSDSEISLKIGHYLMKLRRTKCEPFWGHPVCVCVCARRFRQCLRGP